MAVSGADWRKSADRYRTDAATGVGSVPSGAGGSTAVSSPHPGGCRHCVARTLADDTDGNENRATFDSVETGELGHSGPLAIGVVTETGSTAKSSDDSHADGLAVDSSAAGTPTGDDPDGDELHLRSLCIRVGHPTRCVGRRPIHGGAPSANENRRQSTDHTVIIK